VNLFHGGGCCAAPKGYVCTRVHTTPHRRTYGAVASSRVDLRICKYLPRLMNRFAKQGGLWHDIACALANLCSMPRGEEPFRASQAEEGARATETRHQQTDPLVSTSGAYFYGTGG